MRWPSQIHQDPRAIGMLLHEVGGKRLAQAVPAEFRRHVEPRLSRFLRDHVEIVPHGLVADALSAFREEERCIGPGIGEVRADVVFIDTHRILRKRGEDRLAYPLP